MQLLGSHPIESPFLSFMWLRGEDDDAGGSADHKQPGIGLPSEEGYQ